MDRKVPLKRCRWNRSCARG